jgi:uncharacterized protein YqgV (UPF0045/DUF77 family)
MGHKRVAQVSSEAAMPETQADETPQIAFQFSLYPLRQDHVRPAIAAALEAAAQEGVSLTVGRLSTFAVGSEEAVFAALRAAFAAARQHGSTVMVVTLSSGVPSDATLATLQDKTQG